MSGKEAKVSNVCRCSLSNIAWVCAHFEFIVHTLCHYCGVDFCCRQQSLQAFEDDLKSCKLRMRVQCLSTNKTLLSCGSTPCHK